MQGDAYSVTARRLGVAPLLNMARLDLMSHGSSVMVHHLTYAGARIMVCRPQRTGITRTSLSKLRFALVCALIMTHPPRRVPIVK